MLRKSILILLLLAAAPLAAQTAFIHGTVYADGGQPLSNMTVAAYGVNGLEAARTQSSSQGNFTLALAPGKYRILAYDNAGVYATTFYPNATSFETSALLDLIPGDIVSNISIVLVRGIRLIGRVDSGVNSAPLANAVVAAYNLDGTRRGFTRTNSAGMFTMVVPPGSYKLAAWDEIPSGAVHAPQFFGGRETWESADIVVASTDRSNLNFLLASGARISGRVFDRATGAAIVGATVTVYDRVGVSRYTATTDQNGSFSMVVAGGSYKLVAADPERKYAVSFYRDAVTFETAATLNLVPPANLTFIDFGLLPADSAQRTVLFIAGVANLPGQGNTYFQSDVWIQNPSTSASLDVTVTYLPEEQDNSGRTGVTMTIPPRQQLHIVNVLQQVFGITGKGGLRIEAVGQVRVTSRTYNNPSNASIVGTHGMSIPALPLGDSIGRGVINGLANNASYRSNVGVLNPNATPIVVSYILFASNGTQLGSAIRTFRPLEFFQASTIFTFLNVPTTANIDNAYLVVSSADGSFFAYGSVVDQKSGDGTYLSAIRD